MSVGETDFWLAYAVLTCFKPYLLLNIASLHWSDPDPCSGISAGSELLGESEGAIAVGGRNLDLVHLYTSLTIRNDVVGDLE